MSILVTGSIAYDNIMDFPGRFRDHILPEKIHMLSVSFLVDNLKRMRGGAGANVAYNLSLLGERATILAAVGEDFGDYRDWLESKGVDTTPVRVVPGEFTASCFITTDLDDNQITGFYPGAMRKACELSLGDAHTSADLVVISPDDPAAMAKYPSECRTLGTPYVYSPGQQTVSLSAEQLLDGVSGARCVIGNDYEMEMIASKTGRTPEALLDLAETVIVTYGERGSRILTADGPIEVAPVAPARVVDPTGAGDAYLAGVAYGLARGLPPKRYGATAAALASQAVTEYGTQSHTFAVPALTGAADAPDGET